MSGIYSQTSLELLQENTEQNPKCLMAIFRGPSLINGGLIVIIPFSSCNYLQVLSALMKKFCEFEFMYGYITLILTH